MIVVLLFATIVIARYVTVVIVAQNEAKYLFKSKVLTIFG